MTHTEPEISREVVIVNELGLHARSAAKIAELAHHAKARIWMQKDNRKADASSILDILTLACEKGSRVRFMIEDKADSHILQAITELVAGGFGE